MLLSMSDEFCFNMEVDMTAEIVCKNEVHHEDQTCWLQTKYHIYLE